MFKFIYQSIFLSSMLFLQLPKLNAQTITLPYKEEFETPFLTSSPGCTKQECSTEFLPGWTGNEVQLTSRIYLDTNEQSGSNALGMIPLSSFTPEIVLTLTSINSDQLIINFFASSFKNGGEKDTRSSILYISYSSDGGLNYSTELEVDSFKNEKVINYKHYTFPLLSIDNSIQELKIRFRAVRAGVGSGQAARILLDDLEIIDNLLAVVHEYSPMEEAIQIIHEDHDKFYLNKKVSGKIYNMLGNMITIVEEKAYIDKANLEAKGIYIFQTESGSKTKLIIE